MEDTIHKRLRKLAILLETCQDELATLTNELSDVSIAKNQPSSLTQQFMALSPSDPSPNPRQYKKRDVKNTPAFVRQVTVTLASAALIELGSMATPASKTAVAFANAIDFNITILLEVWFCVHDTNPSRRRVHTQRLISID